MSGEDAGGYKALAAAAPPFVNCPLTLAFKNTVQLFLFILGPPPQGAPAGGCLHNDRLPKSNKDLPEV